MFSVEDSIQGLQEAGIKPILLETLEKRPLLEGFYDLSIEDQIEHAIQAKGRISPLNVGACGGGSAGFAPIDCDEPKTYERVKRHLAGLGIEVSVIARSASGNHHIYLFVDDLPHLSGHRNLARSVGKGELRASPSCHIVVPDGTAFYSTPEGTRRSGNYEFLFGGYEALRTSRRLLWRDIKALIQIDPLKGRELDTLPVALPHQPAPEFVYGLLEVIQDAPKGQRIKYRGRQYASRSEAEQAVITTLLLCGWYWSQIDKLLNEKQSPHYLEQHDPTGYVKRSYQSAVREVATSGERELIAQLYNDVKNNWNRSAYLAESVLLAILRAGYRGNTLEPVITLEEIKKHTRGSTSGIHNSLGLLIEDGWIGEIEGESYRFRISEKLMHKKCMNSHRGRDQAGKDQIDNDDSRINNENYKYKKPLSLTAEKYLNMISYSAAYIYKSLSTEPKSIKALASETGISRNTISEHLEALAERGLASRISAGRWPKWCKGEEDIEALARAWNNQRRERKFNHLTLVGSPELEELTAKYRK